MERAEKAVEDIDMFDDIHAEESVGADIVFLAPVGESGGIAEKHDVGTTAEELGEHTDCAESVGAVVDINHLSESHPFSEDAQQSVTAAIVDHGHLLWRQSAALQHLVEASVVDLEVVLGCIEGAAQSLAAVGANLQVAEVETVEVAEEGGDDVGHEN